MQPFKTETDRQTGKQARSGTTCVGWWTRFKEVPPSKQCKLSCNAIQLPPNTGPRDAALRAREPSHSRGEKATHTTRTAISTRSHQRVSHSTIDRCLFVRLFVCSFVCLLVIKRPDPFEKSTCPSAFNVDAQLLSASAQVARALRSSLHSSTLPLRPASGTADGANRTSQLKHAIPVARVVPDETMPFATLFFRPPRRIRTRYIAQPCLALYPIKPKIPESRWFHAMGIHHVACPATQSHEALHSTSSIFDSSSASPPSSAPKLSPC